MRILKQLFSSKQFLVLIASVGMIGLVLGYVQYYFVKEFYFACNGEYSENEYFSQPNSKGEYEKKDTQKHRFIDKRIRIKTNGFGQPTSIDSWDDEKCKIFEETTLMCSIDRNELAKYDGMGWVSQNFDFLNLRLQYRESYKSSIDNNLIIENGQKGATESL